MELWLKEKETLDSNWEISKKEEFERKLKELLENNVEELSLSCKVLTLFLFFYKLFLFLFLKELLFFF